MCNAYTVRPSASARQLADVVSAEVGRLPATLVRRTGCGVVVREEGGGLEATRMRWGFARAVSDSINNARCDHLDSPVWKDALAVRRCLVPVTTFYEWQALPRGGKQAHEIRRSDGDWMWVAGLYEISEKYGMCYATITTEPPGWMVPIHDRMLAVLDFPQAMEFLRGERVPCLPYAGELEVAACESPLKRGRGVEAQGELF